MQEILYASEQERNMKLILRYHLQSYLLIDLVRKMPKGITVRKLYGKYFHSLSRHAGKQLRIVCGKSTHAEQEERQFNLLKTVTKLTSNHHPTNVIFNLWIRLHAKKILDEKHHTRPVTSPGFAWRLHVFTIPSSFPVFVSFSPVFFRIFIGYIFSLTPHFLPSQHRILSKFSGIASVVGI